MHASPAKAFQTPDEKPPRLKGVQTRLANGVSQLVKLPSQPVSSLLSFVVLLWGANKLPKATAAAVVAAHFIGTLFVAASALLVRPDSIRASRPAIRRQRHKQLTKRAASGQVPREKGAGRRASSHSFGHSVPINQFIATILSAATRRLRLSHF